METRLEIVLIFLLVAQVAARGGGRTSGGKNTSCHLKISFAGFLDYVRTWYFAVEIYCPLEENQILFFF